MDHISHVFTIFCAFFGFSQFHSLQFYRHQHKRFETFFPKGLYVLISFLLNIFIFQTSALQDNESQDNIKQILNSKMWILQIDQEERRPENSKPRWSSMVKRFSDWLSKAPADDISRIDTACRKLFPICFFLFAVIYWVHYLSIYRREGR